METTLQILDALLQALLSNPELTSAVVMGVLGMFGVRRELQLRAARKAAELVEDIHADDDVARGAIEAHLTGAAPLTHPDAPRAPARAVRPGLKLAAKLATRALREARERRYVALPPRRASPGAVDGEINVSEGDEEPSGPPTEPPRAA